MAALWTPPPPRPHILLMSVPKGGKTTLIADMPKPLRVLQFDPIGAEAAYHLRGLVCEYEVGSAGQRIQRVLSRKPPHPTIIQIDFFTDDNSAYAMSSGQVFGDASGTHAYEDFRAIRQELIDEVNAGMWASVALDSTSFLEIAATNLSTKLNPSKEGKKMFGDAMFLMRQDIMMTFAQFPCNVVVACHIDEDKDELEGRIVRNPKLPGKLRVFAAGGYTEVYRVYWDEETGTRRLQTRPRDGYNCGTSYVIDAPDDIEIPDRGVGIWKLILSNYTARLAAETAALAQKGEPA